MNPQHKNLALGRWNQLGLTEQMANIGSEVQRAINWKNKNNPDYFTKAFERALELLDFSLDDPKNKSHLKELARLREALVDYLWGQNEFSSTDQLWSSYFSKFTYAARRHL